jgi:hypothetical protein
MKKEDKNILWYIIIFCVSVIGLHILSRFQYEECNEEGWLEVLFAHAGSIFMTGLFCLGFLFLVFILFVLLYWIVNDDLKEIINSISPIAFSVSQKETNSIYGICLSVVIYVSGYFLWGDLIYGCI